MDLDLPELEARCWTLAGERMRDELFVEVAAYAPSALGVIEWLVDDPELSVADAFAAPEFIERVSQMDLEEAELLIDSLLTWAGESRRPEVVAVDALDAPPPRRRAELRAWVMKHGIRERLKDPLRLAAPLAWAPRDRYGMMVSFTIGDVIDGRAGHLGQSVEDAVWAYLAWAAGRRAKMEIREDTWDALGRSENVAEAARRVRALLKDLHDTAPAVVRRDQIRMGPTEDALGWAARTDHGHVWLSFAERSQHADRAVSSRDQGYVHDLPLLRLAAEHALDALLDPRHPEHEAVTAALEKPRWTYLVADLEQRLASAVEHRALDPDQRLSWRVNVTPGPDYGAVHGAVQKQSKRGWTKGRQVRLAWLQSRPGPLAPDDRRVVDALSPNYYTRTTERGAALDALAGHPLVHRLDDPKVPLQVVQGAVGVVLEEPPGQRGTRIRFSITRPGGADHGPVLTAEALLRLAVSSDVSHAALHRTEGSVERLVVARVPGAVRELALAALRWDTVVPREADEALLALMGQLPERVAVELPARLRGELVEEDGRTVVRLEPRAGRALSVEVRVRPLAGGPSHLPGHGPQHLVGALEGRRVHVRRDLAEERSRANRVQERLGLSSGVVASSVALGPWGHRVENPEDALDVVAQLGRHPEDMVAEWPSEAWSVLGSTGGGDVRVKSQRAGAWFEVGGDADVDETRVSLLDMVRALRGGRRYVEVKKGQFVALEAELRQALEIASDALIDDGTQLRAAPEAAHLLADVLPGLDKGDPLQELGERVVRARVSLEDTRPDAHVPGLNATLRAYQKVGVAWLRGLAGWSSGACLADDMGLGKTLQSIALLLDRKEEGPSLVVAPTSVADNWAREIERFAGSLRPRVYRGTKRAEQRKGLGAGDVLITSYGLLTRDIETLESLGFGTLVLDEAHALKNLRAQRTKAARRIDAGFTLGLTGTPIENHLGELFSLFDVLVPGLLGTWEHFRARFAAPIERDGNLRRRDALSRLIRPFLLRRQKRDVAPELPPRIEVVRRVELSPDERARYETERREAKRNLEASSIRGEKARFKVLAALTRMRRLVCHPALVDDQYTGSSSKLDAVLALARDLAREGHRTLLFSQFTGHLGLVRRGLSELGFDPLYLDGATPAGRRSELVDAFQRGDTPFFLISLKAGGTGLNLTAADTVIHLDPWWNPAAEDQASDRAHRIGQERPVTVVRLVAEQTLEETVLALHESKRELARGVLQGSDRPSPLDVRSLLGLLDGPT